MLQTVTIPCVGGLDLASTSQELLQQPNKAIQLVNMEPDKNGGYRRISGYTALTDNGGSGVIKGSVTYKGYLVIRGRSLYHSFDGASWLLVNTDAVAGSDDTAVLAATEIPVGTADDFRMQSDVYYQGTQEHFYATTGVGGKPFYLLIEGNSQDTATYTFREVTLGSELVGAQWMTLFQDQVILAGTDENPSSIIYSSFASTDLDVSDIITPREKYDGSTSGEIGVKRPITGIAEHREMLYVFTDRTIDKVTGLREGNPTVVPVSRDIGCISGFTIQEIGGDLLFLAADGLRTVSQTERIDDVELGVVSAPVYPITESILDNIERLSLASCVIRKKNQYRLWYKNSSLDTENQKGLIAVLGASQGAGWEFGEIKGWELNTAYSGEDTNGIETLVSGDDTGSVYTFEVGSDFNGSRVPWTYQTAYTDLGDIGIRKNIHDVKTKMRTEGVVEATLEIKYDYNSSRTPQPPPFDLGEITQPFLYGTAVYGAPTTYGVATEDDPEIYGEGSGFTVSLRFTDKGQIDDPFTIESILINYTRSGRI